MYSYSIYGLHVRSEFPLPELIAANAMYDVFVRLGELDSIPAEALANMHFLKIDLREAVLSNKVVGTFLIRNGREIVVIPALNVDQRLLRRYLLGTVMAILLYQRGMFVLHASSVSLDGKAIAFLGEAGSGKSSLAAAFHVRGYDIISDDISPIEFVQNLPVVFPGFPQIKISVEAAETIGCETDRLLELDNWEEKRGYRLENGFAEAPLHLSRVYVLDEDVDIGVEQLNAQDAVKELIRHSFPTRLAQPGNEVHFSSCVRLVNRIPIYRLKRSSSIDMLARLVDFVEGHILGKVHL